MPEQPSLTPSNPFTAALDAIEDTLVPLPEPSDLPPIPPSLTTVEDLNIPAPGEPEPIAPPAPEPPAIEAPPIPVAAPPPAAEPPPLAAAEPAVSTPPAGGPESPGSPFKAMREAKQREAEALAELQAARERERVLAAREVQYQQELERIQRERQAAPTDEPAYIDPLEERLAKVEQANRQLLAENQHTQLLMQQQAAEARLLADDAAFVPEGATHAEYESARNWYIDQQIKEAEANGEMDEVVAEIRTRVSAPQARMYADEIRAKAIELGTTEAEILRTVARQTLYQQRVNRFRQSAEKRGTSVPALVYEAARVRGWSGAPRAAEPAPATAMPVADSAVTQLHREQVGAVESSLASMPTTTGAPPSTLTATTFMSMDRNRQGQLIDYMDQAAARGMVPEDWIEQLNNGVTIPVPTKLVNHG